MKKKEKLLECQDCNNQEFDDFDADEAGKPVCPRCGSANVVDNAESMP
jgi:Zn finger protein HypA/HybF involved in hydrogenase expression